MFLPTEIIHEILSYLSSADIKNFSYTNSSNRAISNDNFLWCKLVNRDYVCFPYDNEVEYMALYNAILNDLKVDNLDHWKYLCYKYKDQTVSNIKLIYIAEDAEQTSILLNILKHTLTKLEISNYCKSVELAENKTPLHVAESANQCKILLDNVEDVEHYCNMLDDFGRTALFYSTSAEHSLLILENISDTDTYCRIQDKDRFMEDEDKLWNFESSYGNTVLHTVESLDQLQVLFDNIKNFTQYCGIQNDDGQTLLFTCTGYEITKFILTHVEDPDILCLITDYVGRTPLFYSDEGKTKAILEHIHDINPHLIIQDNFYTPLFTNNHVDAIKLILSTLKDPEAFCMVRGHQGLTPLHIISNPKIVELILQNVTSPAEYCLIQNDLGETALHTNHNVSIKKILLANVVDKNSYCRILDTRGHTALYYARSEAERNLLLNNVDCPKDYIQYLLYIITIHRLDIMDIVNSFLIFYLYMQYRLYVHKVISHHRWYQNISDITNHNFVTWHQHHYILDEYLLILIVIVNLFPQYS